MQLISTMATPLLVFGARAVFECIDATTDAAVTGVTITDPVISGVNLSADPNAVQPPVAGPFMLVPGPEA
jgi:hypothetical protein